MGKLKVGDRVYVESIDEWGVIDSFEYRNSPHILLDSGSYILATYDEIADYMETHALAADIDTLRSQPEDDNTRALLMAAYGRFYDAWRHQNGGE